MVRFRPMLAPLNSPMDTPTFFEDIVFPQFVSAKVDGIRGLAREVPLEDWSSLDSATVMGYEKKLLTRSLEMAPSTQVQQLFSHRTHSDGELVDGLPYSEGLYNRTQSCVMSANKPGDLNYYLFDWCDDEVAHLPYYKRHELLVAAQVADPDPRVHVLPQVECNTLEELLEQESVQLDLGYEGIMFRNPVGHYKHNRATYNENLIYKLKRFTDAEAKVIGLIQGEKNNNIAVVDARGFTKRSSSKEGKELVERVGKFVCDFGGTEILVSPGKFTKAQLERFWRNPDLIVGKSIRFRFFGYGMKKLPRSPRAIGFWTTLDS